jgi:serine O-acetyltransferase
MKHLLSDFSKFPDKESAQRWIDDLYQWIFSIRHIYRNTEERKWKEDELRLDLEKLLHQLGKDEVESKEMVNTFFGSIKNIYELLLKDADAYMKADPAARSAGEVIMAYPGFYAISVYRLAHQLWNMNIPILPRLIAEYAHSKTGIDIHPAAQIGERFFIDHGTGIVIGETTTIGNEVRLYQGVTLGALSVTPDKKTMKRHPTISNGVVIYANATILGGNTEIGAQSIIGGNVWLIHSVPANSYVYHKSEIVIKNFEEGVPPINYII